MAVVVVTGCSSGFGLEGALAFARNGDTVHATMRDPARADGLLEAAAREELSVRISQLDVTQSESFADRLDAIVAESGHIDVLVNNAGIILAGSLEDTTEDALRHVMETNFFGPMLLSRAVLPHMRTRRRGLIIMMSSLSGIAGLPGDVAYTGSKFALEGASEALRHEVDRWGIRVALVEGGLYSTNIFGGAANDERLLPQNYPVDSPYRPLVESRLTEVRERIGEAFDPRIVAELFVTIAATNSAQFRWPADEVAEKVLATMFAQTDDARDAFLRSVAGSDWWSAGKDSP